MTLGALIVQVLPTPWQIKLAHCAVSPSSLLRMMFSQCTVSPSSLLRDEVYPVCSGPLIPPERWGLRSGPLIPPERWGLHSVQWAPHPPWEMRFTQCSTSPSSLPRMRFSQCAVSPSSLLRDEVYPVRSGRLIPPERRGLPSVQPAPHLSQGWGLPTMQWALHPFLEMRFIDCGVSPLFLTLPDKWGLPSVQWALHPWLCLRDEVHPLTNPVCSGPLIPNLSWKMRFTQCATRPSSLPRMRCILYAVGPS